MTKALCTAEVLFDDGVALSTAVRAANIVRFLKEERERGIKRQKLKPILPAAIDYIINKAVTEVENSSATKIQLKIKDKH